MTAPARRAPGYAPSIESSLDLLRRAQLGDEDARNQLCARYAPRLRRWARGQVPPGARSVLDTGDVVQEVLIKVLRALPDFEPRHEGGFQGFLRMVLTNKLRDIARRAKRRPPGEALDTSVPDDEQVSPLERAIGGQNRDRFEAARARLDRDDREAIFARLELGFSYDEVARLLGKPTANAARVATRRAMIRLAKEMSRDPHD